MIVDKTKSFLFVSPVSIIVAICGVYLILKEIYTYYHENKSDSEYKEGPNLLTKNNVTLIVTSLAYILLMQVIGIKISTLLISFVLLFSYGVRNKIILIGVPIFLVLIVYVFFERLLNVPFPVGLIG